MKLETQLKWLVPLIPIFKIGDIAVPDKPPMLSQEYKITDAAVFPALMVPAGMMEVYFAECTEHSWNSEQLQVNRFMGSLLFRNYLGKLAAICIINQDDFPFAANENKAAMIAESRALRAFYYWYIMDNFGDAPLVTEPTSNYL